MPFIPSCDMNHPPAPIIECRCVYIYINIHIHIHIHIHMLGDGLGVVKCNICVKGTQSLVSSALESPKLGLLIYMKLLY